MRGISVDDWLPSLLRDESVDVRRRARLIVYACGIALVIDGITALAMPAVNWHASRLTWALAHIAMHLPTLIILRRTRSISLAGNYFVAVVFLQSTLQFGMSNGFSMFGLIAVPVAGAHLVGRRSASFWTVVAIAATLGLATLTDAPPAVFAMAIAIATITLAIGAASIIVETTRASAIADLEAAENSVRVERERLRAFVGQTFPCLAETHEGRLAFVSESVEELLGYTPAEVLAAGESLVREEDVRLLSRRIAAAPPGRSRAEIRVRHRDGRWLWLEVFAIPFGEKNSESHWLFAARDIDEEIQHRERLEQAQRLEGIGALAAGVAHDFNNLLTVISGFGTQLPQSDAREQILDAAASAAELTRQLLAFGRSGPRVEALIDPLQELVSLTPVIRSLLGEEVEFSLRGDAKNATARIAQGRFKQVVLNLVTNAKEAMPSGGRLELDIRRVALEDRQAEALGLSPGVFVEIAIRDTGTGMSEEVQKHAFDPFFSTKGAHRGSGLGLASAYGIARRCHGTVVLESAVGAGTTARVFLPDAHEALAAIPNEAPKPSLAPDSVCVWIVEDDARIQKLMQSALEGAGYQTEIASDAKAALALLEHRAPPRVLVSDVVMPGMRGTELAARMREQSSELRVLYISGYSQGEIGDWRSGEKGVHFLAKPFRPSELVSAVADLLAS